MRLPKGLLKEKRHVGLLIRLHKAKFTYLSVSNMYSVALNSKAADEWRYWSTVNYSIMLMHSPASNLMALTTVQIQWFWHSLLRACQVLQQILCLTWYCDYGFASLFRSANGGAWGLSAVSRKEGCLENILCIGKPSEIVFFNLCRVGSQIVSLYLWPWASLSWWSGTGRKWLAWMRSTTPARESSQSFMTALDRKPARSMPFLGLSRIS